MLSVHVPEPAETLILGNIACVTECRPQSLPYIEFLTKCHSIYPHIGLQQGNMYAHNGVKLVVNSPYKFSGVITFQIVHSVQYWMYIMSLVIY